MTSFQRIKATLEFRIPDRIGIYDSFCQDTLDLWRKQSLKPEASIEDYFDFDFRLFGTENDLRHSYNQAKADERFIVFSVSGPLERTKQDIGFEDALIAIHRAPESLERKISEYCDSIIEEYVNLKNKNFIFDGFWFWEDIAYSKGMVFSYGVYKKILFKFHKKLANFFRNQGMPVIFHSDGDIRDVIPDLIEAGVTAIHPLENSCGLNAVELKKKYKKDLALFGNINVNKLLGTKKAISEEIEDKLSIAHKGGYICCFDSPIPKTATIDNYKFALDLVKKFNND